MSDHFIRPDNDLPKIEHAWIEQEASAIIDLLRNIAGLDNGILYISSHASLVGAVQEWRAEARKILEDAAFIVKAVNSHDELKASLAEMVGIYWGDGDGIEPPPACIQRAKAALASIKETSK